MSQLNFPDSPTPGLIYPAPNGVNYIWDDTVGTGVWLAVTSSPLTVGSGVISGVADVGKDLTYAPGTASGGVGPYTYTWEWKKESDGSTLASNVTTYKIPASLAGDRVYVEITANDSASGSAVASTAPYPAPPATIVVASITGAVAPTTIPGTASFTWADAPGTLSATGCIEFSVNGGSTWVSSASVTNAPGTVVLTRWKNAPSSGVCGDAPGNATITGDLTSSNGETTSFTLVMDRTPDPFTLSPNTETTTPGQVTTQNPTFTISGTNAPSYIWGTFASTGNTPQFTVDGGTTWNTIPTTPGGATVNPGATVSIRFTTGAIGTEVYTVRAGASATAGEFESGVFTVTVNAATITNAKAPTTIPGVESFTWANAPGTLTASGCIEFSVNAGSSWVTSAPVTNAPGTTVITRWKNVPSSGVCGDTPGNATITGTLTSSNGETSSFSLTLDRTPNAFTLSPNTETIAVGQVTTSNPAFSVSGTNAPSYIWGSFTTTGSSPQYSTDGGTTWNAIPASPGTAVVNPGDNVKIRFTTATVGTEIYTVNVGASATAGEYQSGAFTVTTTNAGITNAVAPNTTTGVASFTWADPAGNLSATGCIEFSTDGGVNWGQSSTPVNPSDTILTRWESSTSGVCGQAPDGTTITGTLVNGAISSNFSLTIDRVPSAFTLSPDTESTTRITVTSSDPSFTLAGINSPTFLWGILSGGGSNPQFSVNGGATWSTLPTAPTAGAVANPGATVSFRFLTSSSLGTETLDVYAGASTAVGKYQSDLFTVSVINQPFPLTTFAPPSAPNASPAAVSEAAPFMPTDITGTATATWADGPVTLNGTNMQLAIGAATPSSSISPIDGDTVNLSWSPTYIAGLSDGATASGSISDGRYQNDYSFTVDKQPAFTLPALVTNAATSTQQTTNTINPSNFNCPVSVSFTNPTTALSQPMTAVQYSINGGGPVNVALGVTTAILNPGDTLEIFGDTGSANGASYGLTVTMGVATAQEWLVQTTAGPPSIQTPSITAPVNGSTNLRPQDNSPSGLTLTSSTYTPVNGAGSQTGSTWEVYTGSAGGTPITGSPFTASSSPFNTLFIPRSSLTVSTTYYARVKYSTATPSAIDSNFSSYVNFTTAASFTPTIGAAYEGGYFAGQINDGGTIYNLVVAPRASGGQYSGGTGYIQYKTTATDDFPTATYRDTVYGKPANDAGNNSAHPAFQWARSLTIGGFTDWYIPALYELNVCYYFLKPGSGINNTSQGSNPYAVSPQPVSTNFGSFGNNPGQTTATSFRSLQPEEFNGTYWTSSENTSSFGQAFTMFFGNGTAQAFNKNNSTSYRARAIRRVAA